MALSVFVNVLRWIGIVLLTIILLQLVTAFIAHLIKLKKKKKQEEIKNASKGKNTKVSKETTEIFSNLERIKKQAIEDKKSGKYKNKIYTRP